MAATFRRLATCSAASLSLLSCAPDPLAIPGPARSVRRDEAIAIAYTYSTLAWTPGAMNARHGPDSGGILVHTATGDRTIEMPDEPGHQQLCDAEQAFMLLAIAEDIDLTRHMNDAVQSLAICLAADESVRSGRPVKL